MRIHSWEEGREPQGRVPMDEGKADTVPECPAMEMEMRGLQESQGRCRQDRLVLIGQKAQRYEHLRIRITAGFQRGSWWMVRPTTGKGTETATQV